MSGVRAPAIVVALAVVLVGAEVAAQSQPGHALRWFVSVEGRDGDGADRELSTPPRSQGSTFGRRWHVRVPEVELAMPPGSAWSCAAVGPFVRGGHVQARRIAYVVRCSRGSERVGTVLWCGERDDDPEHVDASTLLLWDGSEQQGIAHTQLDISCRGPRAVPGI